MKSEYPEFEIFTDSTGAKRKLLYFYRFIDGLNMHFIQAEEVLEDNVNGYKFASMKTNIPLALGDLRLKIRKRLSTNYVSVENELNFNFDEAIGQIGFGGIVIDGRFFTFEQFNNALQTYEGSLLEIKIKDLSRE